jgi:AcrR family transcriptional regulator
MKADEQRATTRSGRRILNGMSDALLEMVSEQSFEQVRVNAICERADYPRATFYNYFADKYDLLDHCWARFAASMETQDFEGASDGFHTLFDRFADLFDRNRELMKAIFSHNGLDGALMRSLTSYFTTRVRESCRANHCYRLEVSGGVPQDLLADFCANTMLLIVRWTFLSATPIGREQAHDLIDQLIVNTETGCPASQKK